MNTKEKNFLINHTRKDFQAKLVADKEAELTAANARIAALESMLEIAYGTILREVDMSHPDDAKFMRDMRAALEKKP